MMDIFTQYQLLMDDPLMYNMLIAVLKIPEGRETHLGKLEDFNDFFMVSSLVVCWVAVFVLPIL